MIVGISGISSLEKRKFRHRDHLHRYGSHQGYNKANRERELRSSKIEWEWLKDQFEDFRLKCGYR